MTHPLACQVLLHAGETILPESKLGADYNKEGGIQALNGFKLNILKYALLSQKAMAYNTNLFKQVIAKYHFDLVIGDEAYEIITAMYKKQVEMENSMVMIEDFIGLQAMTINLLEK